MYMDNNRAGEWTIPVIDAVTAALDPLGWQVADGPDRGPPAIATTDNADSSQPIAIEPLYTTSIDPTTVCSQIVHAQRNDRSVLFVVETEDAQRLLTEILNAPPLLHAARDGKRTFYNGPDRIPLDAGGYALVDAPAQSLVWRETHTPSGPLPDDPNVDRGPRLVLEADTEVVALLADVDSLRAPRASAFPYRYLRDPDTKRFYVFANRDGPDGPIEDFAGVSAIRHGGYTPVPMPLVPEHLLSEPWPQVGFYTIETDVLRMPIELQ